MFPLACTPSDSGVTKITAFSGESVLLPCTCTNTQDKPKSFSWETQSRRASKDGIYIDIFSVYELYRDRISLFNQTSPGNVSLLLSDLTEDDQGSYVCLLEKSTRFIDVFIKSKQSASVTILTAFIILSIKQNTISQCSQVNLP